MYLQAALQWVFLLLTNIVLDILGLFVVAIGIPFRVKGISVSDGREIVNLPKWLHLFGNDFDGLLGDKRMWWRDNTPFGWPVDSFMAMWWWAAVRNPVNNMRMYSMFQCPIVGSTITYRGKRVVNDRPGEGGWQFVICENKGKRWYGFYLVHQWNDTRAFVIRMGFKVNPDHQGTQELPKGMTTKINLWKEI